MANPVAGDGRSSYAGGGDDVLTDERLEKELGLVGLVLNRSVDLHFQY